jgi:hypothetical protein
MIDLLAEVMVGGVWIFDRGFVVLKGEGCVSSVVRWL